MAITVTKPSRDEILRGVARFGEIKGVTAGLPDMALPDFMEYCRLDRVPAWIAPLIDIRLALEFAPPWWSGHGADAPYVIRCEMTPRATHASGRGLGS